MNLFFHFTVFGFCNTYLLGPAGGGDAIIVDPGLMDEELLSLVESNNYYIRNILVTTPHEAHTHGIKTILKIYDAHVLCGAGELPSVGTVRKISDDEEISVNGQSVTCMLISGHSQEAVVYKIGNMLFTGDALGAGRLGDSPNSYAREILLTMVRDKILTLQESVYIFPGHGPPTSLKIEKDFNPYLAE
ncbi:MAG: MBL fold metallo-hydrolase [Spirochaetales bacterium]|nr:MAG: MBL fold metallo-hydrolase [Spirochaetales bacterium]